MITIDLPAQDVNALLPAGCSFSDGKLTVSQNGVFGSFELQPAKESLRLACPKLHFSNPAVAVVYALAPSKFIARIQAELPEWALLSRDNGAIVINVPNTYIWDCCRFEWLPRDLKLVKVIANTEGIKLGFDLKERQSAL